ncbi:hypothetical protein DW839_04580 [Enterocloster bolteae]|uniref:Uncharacterized protein n=1 Tax=Enterocloster bolteae TaxID=208479 RepID=A0A414AZT9_9FIRM|nr:hypothetical protein DW839_04580 [Enterocloster bolteae]
MFVVNRRLFDSKNATVMYNALEDKFEISIYSYYVLNNYRRTTKGCYDIVKNYFAITADFSMEKFKAIEEMRSKESGYLDIEKRIKGDELLMRSIVYYALNSKSKAITYTEPFQRGILESGYTESNCQKGLEYVMRTYAKQELDNSVSYMDIMLDAY